MEIKFDPVNHKYTNIYTNEEYTSVTRFLHQFKAKFNADEAAKRVALREGCSVQDILDRWKAENLKSQEFGTNIHQVIEKFLIEGEYEPENTTLCKEFKKIFPLRKRDGLEIEKITHLHEYKIAGMADIIAPYKEYFDVYDLKTNKVINYFSKYGEYMASPLQHLPSCEFTLYSLQISLYAYAYSQMTGRKFRQAAIFYWDRDAQTFSRIPVMYLKKEIEQLLEIHKETLENAN
jgi:hypothetical protein